MSRQATTHADPGALLRLPIAGGRWAEDLPPVPRGVDVTVSFSSEEAAAEHGDALALLGYRVVGVHHPLPGAPGPCAALRVPGALIATRPRWWCALKGRADRSYALAFGPVARVFGDLLRLHDAES
jgi:hypothetical protein